MVADAKYAVLKHARLGESPPATLLYIGADFGSRGQQYDGRVSYISQTGSGFAIIAL
jgi:hypothetical protein